MEPSESTSSSLSPGAVSDAPGPESRPLVETKARGPKAIIAILVAIIVVLAAALAFVELYHPAPPVTSQPLGTLSIQSEASTGVQGQPIAFTIQNLRSDAVARVSMGDGVVINTANKTFTYSYASAGNYIVWVQEVGAKNNTVFADNSGSLLKLYVSPPQTSTSLVAYLAFPTIAFNTTKNPNAPITTPNTPFYLYGGYQQIFQLLSTSQSGHDAKTGVNWTLSTFVTIDHYAWDFGNGQTQTVLPNTTAPADDPNFLLPVANPVSVSYPATGLYTATISLVTAEQQTLTLENRANKTTTTTTGTIGTFTSTLSATIAVGSNFGIQKYRGIVPSPGVITEIVSAPGGPSSFDPQIDYETVGFEVVVNTMMTLIIYNGSSTSDWIPWAAQYLPTTSNGGIRDNFMNYTFHLRPGLKFSNGDPLTAYDVWYSTIRAILFQGGEPGTADWIIAKYLLVPAPPTGTGTFVPFVRYMTDPNNVTEFNNIMKSVSYDSTNNNVSFHLFAPTTASLFFTAVTDALGMGIMDAKWLQEIGEAITFTPHGFYDYQNKSLGTNYNLQAQFHPVASGPFEINTYVPASSIVLTPNPYYAGIPSIPAQNKTVILEWVTSPAVAYQLFASGQGDIVTLLPPAYYKTIRDNLVPNQQARIEGPFPSITEFFFVFNLNINTTMLSSIGSSFSIPSDYFANLYVRQAFAEAFNYTNYVDNVLGNKRYGFNFGSPYCGVIVNGLPDYVPPSTLGNCPSYDLVKAKSLLYQSGDYNLSVNFPIFITAGVTQDFQAATIWAAALNQIDPNIVAVPTYTTFASEIGFQVNDSNPMPLFDLGWIADYPYPSDYTDAMYLGNGTYPGAEGWYWWLFNREAALHPTQASMYRSQAASYDQANALMRAADAETNAATAAAEYAQAERICVGLYMYVYTYQYNGFWITKQYMSPYNNVWGYQENPTIGAGADSVFWWWTKG